MKMRAWLFGLMGILTLGLFLFMAGYFVIYLNGQKLLLENLEKLKMAEATTVYDRGGNEYAKLYMQNRELVALDQVPDLLEEAIIATEDQRFYEHAGVDFWSIGRAIVKDIIARDLVEGGSTITQQLAKNMFLSADKTFFRKATEVSIALALENSMEKGEILERYLNYIYLGNGAYGVQAAAERHFGKTLDELSTLEIAVIAALPKAPETYSPINNPEKALERAAIVLSLLKDQGYITEEERREALNSKLSKPKARGERVASAMKDYVLAEAARLTGLSEQELRIGGYLITTTVDLTAQRAVDNAFANAALFPENGPDQISQGAMVIVDPKTGGIAAMSGGRDYVEKGLNRALADRQPGSSFKPIAVYAPALETGGYGPYSMLKDEKMSFGNYNPSNLSGKYAGQMTMLEAVQRSINLPAVWLLNEIGVDQGLKFAKKVGVEMDADDRNLAIALGGLTRGASPLEMARAFGVFANHGVLADTFVISVVKRSDGQIIYEHKGKETRVLSEQSTYDMTVMLQAVTKKGGTGTKANFGRPVAGKTGTTQLGLKGVKASSGNRDIWFVGYTPQYAAAVWMGFDDTNTEHYVKSGSGTAAAMFATVMKDAMKNMKVRDFVRPKGVKEPEPVKAPTAITDLSAAYDVEQQGATLAWSPVEKPEGIEYRLYRKEATEEAFQLVTTTEATNVVDISLMPGKTYQYYVTVYSLEAQAESESSNTAEVVVPELAEDDGMILPDLLPGQEPPADGLDPDDGTGQGNAGDGAGNNDGNSNGSGSGEGTTGGSEPTDGGGSNGSGGGTGTEPEPPAEPDPNPEDPLIEPDVLLTPDGL
jgi:penicillin-binding protein 2A